MTAIERAHRAWTEFLDVLRASDPALAPFDSFDEFELAEGYRNLTDYLIHANIERYMSPDLDRPEFLPLNPQDGEQWSGEHPDVKYFWASLRGDRRYRIVGQRGDEAYLAFTLHRGTRGSTKENYIESVMNHHDLVTDDDGRFEIIVSPTQEGKNWLRLTPDATEIFARFYRFDPIHDRLATFSIEPLDPPPPAKPMGLDEVAERIEQLACIIRDRTESRYTELGRATPNQTTDTWRLTPDQPSRTWAGADIAYNIGGVELKPGQALILEGIVVPCDYWGLQFWSPWMNSGDARFYPVSINRAQARLGENGEFKVAIAREDPKVPGLDWISTAGHRRGRFAIRWVCPETHPPTPTCQLVDVDSLRVRTPIS
ncbi:MAG TPA: DUF1214 domain-containing protein [Acidimicrobiales bacterium]|nr:DUF1214 domain-containing protein [Acidimicrobiales bacterium]